jgi:hypothetical protein
MSPVLVFRKDIWKHFPVHVIPLGSDHTGAECHKIVWNRHAMLDTKELMRPNLMNALRASDRWSVHLPQSPDAICIIRMLFKGVQPRSEDTVAKYEELPSLRSLDDLKMHYPVVWTAVSDSIYAISLHNRRLKDYMRRKGYDCLGDITQSLMWALKSSTAWRVLSSPHNAYICLLEIC